MADGGPDPLSPADAPPSHGGVDAVGDVRAAAYGYRGDEVRKRMLELDLGDIEVETKISYILSRD